MKTERMLNRPCAVLLFLLISTILFTGGLFPVQTEPELSVFKLMDNLEKKEFSGHLVDMNYSDAVLEDVIRNISQLSGLRFQFFGDTSLKVTLKMRQVPWDKALSIILEGYRLRIRLSGEVLVIEAGDQPLLQIVEREDGGGHFRLGVPGWILIGLAAAAAAAAVTWKIKKKRSGPPSGRKFVLDPEKSRLIRKKVEYLFEVENIHRDEDLTLGTLAAQMDVPTHHLSRVLNEDMGCTFSELLNRFRIDEIKKRLSDPAAAERSILDIALDAGFGTKSAFNRAFKRTTGKTPTQFRREQAGK